MNSLQNLAPAMRQYLLVTANYWAFTLTDGALRMLVLLFFYDLGYAPLQIALLFVFYEVFGVVTNLLGGWLGARLGLNRTMNLGLILQVVALGMLLVPPSMLTVAWVMLAQALSGIAKDLNKMSAKSAIKVLLPGDAQGQLYKWVAILTGSKNALKGLGFFLGGALLSSVGFRAGVGIMAVALTLIWLFSIFNLSKDLGKAKSKPKFTDVFSKSRAINLLSAARLFLFGARDVWFVVALPVFLTSELHWKHQFVGGFLALWVIGYGLVQSLAPMVTNRIGKKVLIGTQQSHSVNALFGWAFLLAMVPAAIALAMQYPPYIQLSVVAGLILFGVIFAINSSLHSFLIVSYASEESVSLDVGFYYMANALGRLLGTVLSGWIYQNAGLALCLWVSSGLLLLASIISLFLSVPGKAHSSH